MTRRMDQRGFVARKLLHASLIGAVAAGAIAWGRWPTLPIASGVLALLLAGEWLRTRSPFFQRTLLTTLGPLMTAEERRKSPRTRLNGATWAMVAAVLALIVFPMPVAVAALLVLALGDPAAALAGRFYGRIRIGQKSLEGSAAFLAVSLLAVLALTPLPLAVAAAGCALAALVELIPLPGYDNLWITLAAGGGMMAVAWLP